MFRRPARDKAGRTLLHTAVLYGNVDVVKFLIDQYPHLINTTDNVRGIHYYYYYYYYYYYDDDDDEDDNVRNDYESEMKVFARHTAL